MPRMLFLSNIHTLKGANSVSGSLCIAFIPLCLTRLLTSTGVAYPTAAVSCWPTIRLLKTVWTVKSCLDDWWSLQTKNFRPYCRFSSNCTVAWGEDFLCTCQVYINLVPVLGECSGKYVKLLQLHPWLGSRSEPDYQMRLKITGCLKMFLSPQSPVCCVLGDWRFCIQCFQHPRVLQFKSVNWLLYFLMQTINVYNIRLHVGCKGKSTV